MAVAPTGLRVYGTVGQQGWFFDIRAAHVQRPTIVASDAKGARGVVRESGRS